MSEIKALKELRELCVGVKGEGFSSVGCDAVLEIADEIEREHAQRVAGLTGDLCSYELRNKELKDALKAICNRFGVSSTKWSAEDAAKEVLEALERDYMALPVDADGVPIRMGDSVKGELLDDSTVSGTVCAFHLYDDEPDSVYIKVNVQGGWTIKDLRLTRCRHIKPRTLESVLADLANEVWEASCTCQTTWSDSGLDGIEKKYADELRELMEVEQ